MNQPMKAMLYGAALLVLLHAAARAASPPREDFAVLFERGKSLLMTQDKPVEAYRDFRRAYDLRPDPCLAIWIGRAAMEADLTSDAMSYLLKFKSRCPRAGQKRAELEQRLAKLRGQPAPKVVAREGLSAAAAAPAQPSRSEKPSPVTQAPATKGSGSPVTEDDVIAACTGNDKAKAQQLLGALREGDGRYAAFYCRKVGVSLMEESARAKRELAVAEARRQADAEARRQADVEARRQAALPEDQRKAAAEASRRPASLDEARSLLDSNPMLARAMAERLAATSGATSDLWEVIGRASCKLNDKSVFYAAYQQLNVDQRREILSQCQRFAH